MSKRVICLLTALLLLPAVSVAAEILPLDNFIRTAVKNNPAYGLPAQDYLIALQKNKSAESIRDWNLIASAIWNESNPAPLSALSSTYQKTVGIGVGVEKYFVETGTAVKLEHKNTRVDAEYPALITIPGIGSLDFYPPGKYYLADASLTITQPLLRNAFGLAAKNSLKMSAYSLELARIKLSEDREDFIALLREKYLAWQNCRRNVDLLQEKVKTIEDQLSLVRRQKNYGLSEDLDLVQIKQKVQAYRIMLEQAKMAYESQSKEILRLMDNSDGFADQPAPEELAKNPLAMDETAALTYLHTVSNIRHIADIMVALQAANLETKENQKLMDVNLTLNAKPNAFAEDLGETYSSIGAYKENTIRLSASRPLFNQKAEAEAAEAENLYTRAKKAREDILLKSKIGLSSLYTNLQYLTSLIGLNENNLILAKERLTLEEKKFSQGRNSIFFVLQAEDDVLQAENILNQTLFARESIVNQIKSFTDRYAVEYEDLLKL